MLFIVLQTMLEDKIKATDWEATNEAIEEQVARESYLQWLRDNEMRKAVSLKFCYLSLFDEIFCHLYCMKNLIIQRSATSTSTSTVTSAQHSHNHFHSHNNRTQQRGHSSSTPQTNQDSLRNSPKVC